MGSIRIGHANLYAKNPDKAAAIALLTSQGCQAIGFCEGKNFEDYLSPSALGFYRKHVASSGENVRAYLDTGVLVSSDLPCIGEQYVKISETVPTVPGYGVERWVSVAMFVHPGIGPTALVEVHPVAGEESIMGTDPNDPVTLAYAEGMLHLDRVLTFLETYSNMNVIVCADAQITADCIRDWSMYPVLAKHGMTVFPYGIDLIAISSGLKFLSTWAMIKQSRTGSDHPWLFADVVKA